jgi:hypothetical protein
MYLGLIKRIVGEKFRRCTKAVTIALDYGVPR